MRRAVVVLACAAMAAGADDSFERWWPSFQSSVAKGDAAGIVKGATFPLGWELGAVREVASRDEFVTHFTRLFTADMKRAVAREKPVKIPEGYMITWHARGNEYSLYFHASGGAFALAGLSEGPP